MLLQTYTQGSVEQRIKHPNIYLRKPLSWTVKLDILNNSQWGIFVHSARWFTGAGHALWPFWHFHLTVLVFMVYNMKRPHNTISNIQTIYSSLRRTSPVDTMGDYPEYVTKRRSRRKSILTTSAQFYSDFVKSGQTAPTWP